MNKFNIVISLVMPSLVSAVAFAVDGGEKRLMLQIADSYSQCSAYYAVAATVGGTESESPESDLMRQYQAASENRARQIAEKLVSLDVNDKKKVRQIATRLTAANHDAAVKALHNLATSDPEQLSSKLTRYRTDCAVAIADPGAYTRSIVEQKKKAVEPQALASE